MLQTGSWRKTRGLCRHFCRSKGSDVLPRLSSHIPPHRRCRPIRLFETDLSRLPPHLRSLALTEFLFQAHVPGVSCCSDTRRTSCILCTYYQHQLQFRKSRNVNLPIETTVATAVYILMDAKWTFTRRKTSKIFQCASVGAPHQALSKFILYLFTVHGGHQTSQPYKPVQNSGSIAGQWILFYASGYQF
jgi:hypothetical protein